MDNPYRQSYQIQYPQGDVSLERYTPVFSSKQNKIHTIVQGETLQNIAYKYYGDSGSWYLIAEYNNINDPFEEIEEGQQLLIP